MKLFHKFSLLFVFAALVPLLMMAWGVAQVRSSLRAVAEEVQVQTAKRASDIVFRYIENIQSAIAVARDKPGFISEPGVQSASIRSLLDNYPFISGAGIFDKNYNRVYMSSRSPGLWAGFGSEWPAVSEAVRRYGFYVSPVMFSRLGYPEVVMVSSIGGDLENPEGYFAGRVNLLDLCSRLKALDAGQGTVFVYDGNSRLVAHSSSDDLFRDPPAPPSGSERGGNKDAWWSREPVGGMVDGWYVVFKQSAETVFRPANDLSRKLLAYFLLSFALAVLLCWIATQGLVVNRLGDIREAVESIKNRKFSLSLNVKGADEVGQLAREVLEAAKALEAQVRTSTIGIMVQKLSHELRKPLTNIRGSLETARRHISANDEVADKHLGYIEQAVEQGLEYIDEILTLGKDRRPPQKSPIDLGELLRDLRERMPFPPGVQVVLQAELGAVCAADAREASQAVSNVVENAVDALPETGGRIILRARRAANYVTVEVEDNGNGMDENVQKRLFDDFFTTREGGTGLGMGIVRRVMNRHQGRVHVESVPGSGTKITLLFPAEPAPMADLPLVPQSSDKELDPV